jgi:environmental stress-induced protein Ves
MRVVRAADYRRMPWKNGGGATTEVAIAPANATLDDFDWRISMAHVAVPGPFSRFPGIDRTLAILDGHGIRLTVADAPAETLTHTSPPHIFPGDVDAGATLVDGPINDLNVMSRRDRYRHRMTRHRITEAIAVSLDADVIVAMPRGGDIECVINGTATQIGDGDTAIIERADIERINAREAQIRPAGSAETDLYLTALWRR